jgi:hypothetical protein
VKKILGTAVSAVAGVVLLTPLAASPADAAVKHYSSCDAMHRDHKHGVGRRGAHDHTSGTPVTNFYRNTRLYRANNGGPGEHDLDRDNDGIACEA